MISEILHGYCLQERWPHHTSLVLHLPCPPGQHFPQPRQSYTLWRHSVQHSFHQASSWLSHVQTHTDRPTSGLSPLTLYSKSGKYFKYTLTGDSPILPFSSYWQLVAEEHWFPQSPPPWLPSFSASCACPRWLPYPQCWGFWILSWHYSWLRGPYIYT